MGMSSGRGAVLMGWMAWPAHVVSYLRQSSAPATSLPLLYGASLLFVTRDRDHVTLAPPNSRTPFCLAVWVSPSKHRDHYCVNFVTVSN